MTAATIRIRARPLRASLRNGRTANSASPSQAASPSGNGTRATGRSTGPRNRTAQPDRATGPRNRTAAGPRGPRSRIAAGPRGPRGPRNRTAAGSRDKTAQQDRSTRTARRGPRDRTAQQDRGTSAPPEITNRLRRIINRPKIGDGPTRQIADRLMSSTNWAIQIRRSPHPGVTQRVLLKRVLLKVQLVPRPISNHLQIASVLR